MNSACRAALRSSAQQSGGRNWNVEEDGGKTNGARYKPPLQAVMEAESILAMKALFCGGGGHPGERPITTAREDV